MIIGCGTDLVYIPRMKEAIEKWPKKFLRRVFTAAEIKACKSKACPEKHFASRFAAKEAFLKALGTGFSKGISFHEISVENDSSGKPVLRHKGKVSKILKKMCHSRESGDPKKGAKIHVSLSDEKDYALAFVILTSETTS
ncbi:MAG: holo-[acyl-carrier-protein] synthase [Deltaproteobacteria bacterium RIFCSPHIGHO2_02_FULL_40_11]|nr:MAG: holo-[acyl-carrier-protein] synthase [Deltaproteobacteria bacterium RIFCSPHIGHO2_02_FULL_40_11]